MSETPSKLRPPRKSSAKIDIDLDALQSVAGLDVGLIENLNQSLNISAVTAPKAEPNGPLKKRPKSQSPAKAAYKLPGGTTMTSVPRRNLSSARPQGVFKPKVTPAQLPVAPRKAVQSAIDFGQRNNSQDFENRTRIKELEALTAQLSQQLAEYTLSQSTLQGQLLESEQRVQGLESFRKNLESRVTSKEAENSEIEREINRLKDQVEKEREEASNYTQRVKHELGEQIKTLESEKAHLEAELKRTRNSLETAENEITALKSTLNLQSATALDLDCQISALKAKLQAAQSEIISRNMACDELTNKLSDANSKIEALQAKLQEAETMRRKLHNQVQELKGNIRVFCRIRPLSSAEIPQSSNADVEMRHFQITRKLDDPDELCLVQPVESATGQASTKNFPFAFDRVFGPHSTQSDVFDEISQLVQSALDGYRVCIFAYGQTGSGKTFTMEGSQDREELLGMIPRAVLQVFTTASDLNRDKKWQFSFEASYLEIYNESIRDLLGNGEDGAGKHDIRHLPNTTKTIVTDLTTVPVETPESVLALLKKAGHNRAVAETLCNDRSSRSHSVFMLKIVGSNPVTGENIEGLLNLIDLAGSERLSQSGSTGDRLKETQAINKSLSSLGDVIAALASKESHIPYRNSKLTYLLQNSLGGNSKTLMFVNVSPSMANFHETLCSLRFATKVNSCQIGTARRNTVRN